jgi:inner membrane protein involved in colicin E2 resistance
VDSTTAYQLAADTILLLHVLFAAFVVFALLLAIAGLMYLTRGVDWYAYGNVVAPGEKTG